MRRALALVLSLATLALSPLPSASAADTASVDLGLPGRMSFSNATVAVGHLASPGTALEDAGAVGLGEATLPDGTLFVCPARSGQQGEIPPLPVLQDYCRGEDSYENPALGIGGRTWIATRGPVTTQAWPNATSTLLWRGDNGTLAWAASASQDPVRWRLEQGAWAFRPTTGSSEIVVETGNQRSHYNGTNWIFYLEARGTVSLEAAGYHGRLPDQSNLELAPAPAGSLEEALDPRVLLDLQASVRGSDAREPFANATRLFHRYARIPQLVDASLVGALDGSIENRHLDPSATSQVHLESASLAPTAGRLQGTADVAFTRTDGGFGTGVGDPDDVPVWGIGVLWLAAMAVLWLRDPPPTPALAPWSKALLGVVGFGAWDLVLQATIGISGLGALLGSADLAVALALLGFEAIAFLLAWGLVYLPARIVVERVLPRAWSRWARLPTAGVLLLALVLLPGRVIAMGQLVARL